MKLPKRPFHTIALDLVGLFQLGSKGMNVLICMCLTNYPIAIPLYSKTAETVVQANVQCGYATFSESLTLITDNGKEFKNETLQKIASKLGIQTIFQVLVTQNPLPFEKNSIPF